MMTAKAKLFIYLIFISTSINPIAQEYWNTENAQRWIGDTAEGQIEYCQEKSIRWTNPLLGFDINKDAIDDFMFAISCYQGEAVAGKKHNLQVRAAWKMFCSNEQQHYDCTEELFGSKGIEVTSVSPEIGLGNDGGGNPYLQVAETPRDLNGDGYPEFWYAVNRDDGRPGFDDNNDEDIALLTEYCGPRPSGEGRYTWDCTRKSIQTMLISRADGTYQITQLPWGSQNTQAMLILPNEIDTFDVWAMIYGPHKVARYKDGVFTDVTEEYEQDPLWDKVTFGNPYAKAFELDGTYYIARADIPTDLRASWAEDVDNSGFVLWKYTAGEGFAVSDVYTPSQNKTFNYQLQQGNTTQMRFGAMVKDIPVFEPRWHFFDLEILDDSEGPVLLVQLESFAQVGESSKAQPDATITYKYGDSFTAQDTRDTVWPSSAIEGFYIQEGKLVPREKEVIAGNSAYEVTYKRFSDINSDGYLDMLSVSGGSERPSVFLNDGSGTLNRLFLGDVFPDLSLLGNRYFQSKNPEFQGWGAALYPFYGTNSVDLMYWLDGFSYGIPDYAGDDYIFSPGDIVLAKSNFTVNSLKIFLLAELNVLQEICYSNGWANRRGYQLPCRMGLPFIDATEIDSDKDGVNDSEDAFRFDVSESIDTDSDGVGNNSDTDDDNDGLSDTQERINGTNPLESDSDQDGVSDKQESIDGTNPLVADTDGDGLLDGVEASYGTNPLISDTDGDGYSDLDEVNSNTDPLDANSAPTRGLPIWLIKAAKDKMEQDATN